MAKFYDYLRNFFVLLLVLQLAPPFIKNIKTQYEDLLEPKTKVGVVEIKGTISDSGKYIKNLKNFFEDDDIKAIVLKIESPGGSAGSSQAIFNEIKLLRNQYSNKYVITLVENICASGGYYVACASNYIIASPASFIGSIGVYISHPMIKDFIEYYKIKYEVIKSGSYKTAGSPFFELTEAQRDEFQSLSDNVYQQFTKDVAERRPHVPADIKKWADGRIFTGEQAFNLKLVDELGSASNVVKVLRDNAHIEGNIEWVRQTKKASILSALFSQDDESESYLNSCITRICEVLESRYGSATAKCESGSKI